MGNSCNSKKMVEKNSIFFRFSRKWCGILAFHLRRFTEIGGSTEWLQKVGDFLETFPPEGAEFL